MHLVRYTADCNPDIMCRLDGLEVAAFRAACVANKIWGCFSIMEFNPKGNPYNTGIIIDDKGGIALYYRKLHPWVGQALPGVRLVIRTLLAFMH
jgi:formamidase